jgi:polyribonucleotide nucleotidyltransferase
MYKKEFSTEVGGKTMTATFSDLAENADGSVLLKYGNTVILATAVMSEKSKEGSDFFPLTVDFESKFYATGQILGNRFNRREGKPSENSILSGRITDRTIRPLFDQRIRHEIQVIITTLAIDEDDPDALGVIGASLALGVSSIPFNGPVSCIRIGKHKVDGYQINPSFLERDNETYEIDLIACGKDGDINMIELAGEEAQENVATDALRFASTEIEKINEWQKKVIAEIGKAKKVLNIPSIPEKVATVFAENILQKIDSIFSDKAGHEKIEELHTAWMEVAKEKLTEEELKFTEDVFEENVNEYIHKEAIDKDRRVDGRKMDELRSLFAEAGGISKVLHGTGTFYRGGTHVLSVLTLGGPKSGQVTEDDENGESKRFLHHYNFPPYSTGETGRVGNTNRRMIGHGALAEKALLPMIPDQATFPYTIRLVSEALASNGSTSMGSVCASTLAMLDGGVPMKKPVAGIASGLMMDVKNPKRFKILTDIQGPEDHHGDMDFKVAGTKDGITAIQMDVKVGGIPLEVLAAAFEKAKLARLQILEVIGKAISAPRKELSPYAPKILTMKIRQDQIGSVIGGGGKVIKEIKERTEVEAIDINDDGSVYITGKGDTADKAFKIIEEMTHEYKRGERFVGEVTKIADFGAFVRLLGDTEGLVHVSEIAPFRIERINDFIKIGDKVPVVVKEVDIEKGRIGLSIKLAAPDFIKRPVSAPRPASAPVTPQVPPAGEFPKI